MRKRAERAAPAAQPRATDETAAMEEEKEPSEREAATAVERPRKDAGVALVGYAPIMRVDAERREIELCATSEALDAHGTIFDYDASKAAFTRWLGNVREMHERRAVGRRVGVRCDDAARRIYVRLRISRGAQDTWEKVLDGTLRGASIGASDVVWRRERRTVGGQSRWAQVATRYDLAELSLVDNPSNPDALGVTFVRDAAPDVTLLDPLEAVEAAEPAVETAERAEDAVPERQPLHEAARSLLAACGCLRCAVALAALTNDTGDADGADDMGDAAGGAVTRALAAGLRFSAVQLAQFDTTLSAAVAVMARHAEAQEQRARSADSEQPQAARVIAELEARLARLEAQPAPGGPAARAVEKTLSGAALPIGALPMGAEVRALEALAGRLRDPQAQLAVAAEMIRLQQEG